MGNEISRCANNFEPSSATASCTTKRPNIETEQLEPFTLVWLASPDDPNIKDQNLLNRLHRITTDIRIFQDEKSCEQWLKINFDNENILFILNSKFGKRITNTVQSLTSVIGIYIFPSGLDEDLSWIQNCSKIRRIIYNADGLIYQLSKDQLYFNSFLASKDFQIFKRRLSTRILDVQNDSFIWYQLLLEFLIESSYLPTNPSSTAFLQILNRYYSNNTDMLILIKQLEDNYRKEKAIKTLLHNTPLARLLIKALREQNISLLFYLRFFLADIYNYLLTHRLQSACTYITQILSQSDIECLQRHVNSYTMFKSFLLTSTDQSNLPMIDVKDNQFQNVLIEIHAENQGDTLPFACVQTLGIPDNHNQSISKILFMPGSIFKIVSFVKMMDSHWKLELTLVGHKEFKNFSDELQKLRTTKDLFIISDLLEIYEQSDKTNAFYRHLLHELPSNHNSVPKIREKLNISSEEESVCLNRTLIIVIKSLMQLGEIESEMLNVLYSISNGSIVIYERISEIDFNQMYNEKSILIFASYETVLMIRSTCPQTVEYFILKQNENSYRQRGIFTNGEDLTFELADRLRRCYEDESEEDLKIGKTFLGEAKKKLSSQIDQEMKNIQKKFSAIDINNQLPINTKVVLVYLMLNDSNDSNDSMITEIQNQYKNIVNDCLTYIDENEFQLYMLTNNSDAHVFLIVESRYHDRSTPNFKQFNSIKGIYYLQRSSSDNEIITDNRYEIFRKLTADLIIHYNELADLFKDRADSNNERDMRIKARSLTELLTEIPNI